MAKYLHKRNLLVGLVAISGVTLLFLFIPTLFAYPSGDDFCFATTTSEYGFVGAQVNWYMTWTGRFFSSLILSANPLVFRTANFYFVMILINLAIFVASTYYWWHNLVLTKQPRIISAIFTLTSSALFIGFIPYPQDTVFWAAGTITYLLPLSFALIASVMISRSLYNLLRPAELALLTLLLAGITASNETFMAATCLSLAAATGIVLVSKRKIPRTLLYALIVAGIFSAFVFFAPGNDVRGAAYTAGRAGEIKFTIKESLLAFGRYFTSSNPAIFGSFLLIGLVAGFFSSLRFRLKSWFNPVVIGLGTFILTFACFAVSYWGTGEVPPLRTFSMIQAVMCIGALGIGMSFTSFYPRKHSERQLLALLGVSTIILTLIAWASPLHTWILQDINSDKYIAFKQATADRETSIYSNCEGQTECEVEQIEWPIAIDRAGDITNDPDHWVNKCVSNYYKLEKLSTSSL